VFALWFLPFVILPSWVGIFSKGNSALLRSLEIALVDNQGRNASRRRVWARSIVLWLLVAGTCLLILSVTMISLQRAPLLSIGLLPLFYFLGRLFLAERPLHNRIAGTWTVPS